MKSPYNPITNSGREVMIWPYHGGFAALLTTGGPERNTIQFAQDGINFEIMAAIENPPEAAGLFRTPDHEKRPLEGLRWGLCHVFGKGGWGYIRRWAGAAFAGLWVAKKMVCPRSLRSTRTSTISSPHCVGVRAPAGMIEAGGKIGPG